MKTLVEKINPRLMKPLSGLQPVARIPKSAMLGFFNSDGLAVWFTEKCTYISTNNRFYKGIY